MMRTKPEQTAILIRSIPRDLRQDFKAWCDKQGTNMTKVFVDFMKEKTNTISK